MILKGYIEEGETMLDAIARVAVLAGQNQMDGYEILCRKCNWPYQKDGGGYSCLCVIREKEKG